MNQEADQLSKEEIAKVFAMYYGCEYQICINIKGKQVKEPIDYGVIKDIEQDLYLGLENDDKEKILLTPLSSITDEHAGDLWSIQGYEKFNNEHTVKTVGRWLEDNNIGYDQYQFLISKGYAVPLWFGIDHWANGKTAIDLGIAIDKTKHN